MTHTMTETNKDIRKALKKAFPNTKFSVRGTQTTYSHIEWINGPTEGEVSETVAPYIGERYDSAKDMHVPTGTSYDTVCTGVLPKRIITDSFLEHLKPYAKYGQDGVITHFDLTPIGGSIMERHPAATTEQHALRIAAHCVSESALPAV